MADNKNQQQRPKIKKTQSHLHISVAIVSLLNDMYKCDHKFSYPFVVPWLSFAEIIVWVWVSYGMDHAVWLLTDWLHIFQPIHWI